MASAALRNITCTVGTPVCAWTLAQVLNDSNTGVFWDHLMLYGLVYDFQPEVQVSIL